MINKNDRVLLAVSGGPDSICIVLLFLQLKKKYNMGISVAHINHNLRGKESIKDKNFVKEFCKKKGINFISKKIDVKNFAKKNKIGIEEAGRNLRYKELVKIAEKSGFNKIATGHTLDDNAETILMWLLRGVGRKGISGIPIKRKVNSNIEIIRPLIEISKKEILNYLKMKKEKFCIDKTNLSPETGFRNKIRHRIIPYLENFSPKIKTHLTNFAEIISGEESILEEITETVFSGVVKKDNEKIFLDFKKFLGYNKMIQYRVIKRLGNFLNFKNIQIFNDFIENGKTGDFIYLPNGFVAHKKYSKITICKKKDLKKYKTHNKKIRLMVRRVKNPSDFGNGKTVACFDSDKIKGNLTLRTRKPGDRFKPFGMKSEKKLKCYFIDEKIDRILRDQVPILTDEEKILWVVGHRISEDVRITDKTKKAVRIKIES